MIGEACSRQYQISIIGMLTADNIFGEGFDWENATGIVRRNKRRSTDIKENSSGNCRDKMNPYQWKEALQMFLLFFRHSYSNRVVFL